MSLRKPCEFCGTVFSTARAHRNSTKFCSLSCSAQAHAAISARNARSATRLLRERNPGRYIRVNAVCTQCGKNFSIKASLINRIKTCSKECSNARKRVTKPVKYRNATIDGKFGQEHRGLARKLLGSDAINGKRVHHIDGDRLNNDLENLIIVNPGDHTKIHNIKRRAGRFLSAKEILRQFQDAIWLKDVAT